ncbi:MAG TPA: hypothetical protein VFL82_15420 [Thermomicrobiales bacterium]|nr:hypothetical protein [Thermomicrobiales bacterium]
MRLFHSISMRHLQLVSNAITLVGLAMVVVSLVLGLDAMWTITGLMLVVAGVIKIVAVHLLINVAGFSPTDPPVKEG